MNFFTQPLSSFIEQRHSIAQILKSQKDADQDRWIGKQMIQSGVVEMTGNLDEDFEAEVAHKVHVVVHNIVPPFLSGENIFSKQFMPVIPIKDITSDMATVAKNGSAVVKAFREQKERKKAQRKDWNLKGTQMGNVLKIKQEAEVKAETDDDIRNKNKFADHMRNKKKGGSEFSKTKTIKEQRQFLPVFSVRDQLLNCIKENNIIIVVGETGSGKTTQLTQYLLEDQA